MSAVFKVEKTFRLALIPPAAWLKHESESMTRWRADSNQQTLQTCCFGCDLGRLKGVMSPLLARKKTLTVDI